MHAGTDKHASVPPAFRLHVHNLHENKGCSMPVELSIVITCKPAGDNFTLHKLHPDVRWCSLQ